MRPSGWTLIQSDSYSYKKRKLRHTATKSKQKEKTMWRHWGKMAVCQPRGDAMGETNPADTIILDFPASGQDCLDIWKQGPESRLELTTWKPGIKQTTRREVRTKEKRGCQVKARDKRNKHLDFQATKEQGGRHHCAPPDEDWAECSAREYQHLSVKEERRMTRFSFYETRRWQKHDLLVLQEIMQKRTLALIKAGLKTSQRLKMTELTQGRKRE